MTDPILGAVSRLAAASVDEERAQRTRERCRKILARRRARLDVNRQAGRGLSSDSGFGAAELLDALRQTLRRYGWR